MNDEIKVPTMQVTPLKKICMTIGELPTSYLETMSYYEMLVWFTNYLRDNIIPVVNNNGEATHELQVLFTELQSYVNNYFDNLDVQDEINNKLDQMLEDGVLEQIIEQFLQLTSLICFDNVADMKVSTNLANGSYAKTLGYYSVNDGGESLYKVRTITNEDVVDEMFIIALSNNTLVAELIIKDDTINIMQLGAKGDGTTDDTNAIIKAINYFHVGTDADNQNYATVLLRNYPDAGGTIYFPKGVYCISSTIKIPCYVDVDFGYSTIKAISGGTFTNNYMFSVNSYSLNSWTYAYANRKGFIKNGYIDGNNIENIRGFYILDPHHMINLEFHRMYNSINYESQRYIDGVYIDNCSFGECKGTDYQIRKRCYGENLYITNVGFDVTTPDGTPANGIELMYGHNGMIKNIVNGNIKMSNTEDFTISNWHCENGYFYSSSSNQTIIRDSNIYVKDEQTPITLESDNYNNGLRSIFLENVKFVYYLSLDEFNYDTKDIDISTYRGNIFLKGCYRDLWLQSINSISQTGIQLYDGTNYILNPYDECEIYDKKIIPKNSTARRDNIAYGISNNDYVKWNLETRTYYYKLINFTDVNKLCGKDTDEINGTISDVNKGFRISINGNLGYGNTLRLYRGTTSGTYTHYVDIPNPKNMNIYDNGYSVNGYKWKTTNESVPSLNAIPQIERIDTFNNTLVKCKGYANPSYGTWTQGDIIERLNPSANGTLGWVCTTGGTPGTWKEFGNIAN